MNNDIIRSATHLPIKNMLVYYPQEFINLSNMLHNVKKDTNSIIDINHILIAYSNEIVKNNYPSVFKEVRDNIRYENNLHIGFFVEGESKDCGSAIKEAEQLLSFLDTYKFDPDLPIFYYYHRDDNLNTDICLAIIKEFMDTIKNNSKFKVGFTINPTLINSHSINMDIISEYDYLSYSCRNFTTTNAYDTSIVVDNTIDCVGYIYSDEECKLYNTPPVKFKHAFLYTDYNVAIDHPIGDEAIICPKTGNIRFRKWISPREYVRNDIVYYKEGAFRIYGQDGLSILSSGQDICIKENGHIFIISCDDEGYMICREHNSVGISYRDYEQDYRYFLPNKRIKEDILTGIYTENKADNDKSITILLCNDKYGDYFGRCAFEINDAKKSVDRIDLYLYHKTHNNATHHVIEYPLSLSINDLKVIMDDIGITTDSVGNFENRYSEDVYSNDYKRAYSIANLIDIIYCSLPSCDNYDKDRMLFLYRSYFDIILKKLLPGYYIVDPISNVQAVPIEANDMVKQIDRMIKTTHRLLVALIVLSIVIVITWIASMILLAI